MVDVSKNSVFALQSKTIKDVKIKKESVFNFQWKIVDVSKNSVFALQLMTVEDVSEDLLFAF